MSTIYKDQATGIELEKPEADFIDDELLEQPEPVYRIDDRGRRFYYTLNENNKPTFYGSCTSIKSQTSPKPRAIIDKEIQMGPKDYRSYIRNRQQLGTFYHILASEATINRSFDFHTLKDRIDLYTYGTDSETVSDLIEKVKGADSDYDSSEVVMDIIRRTQDRKVEYTEARFGKSSWHYELSRGLMAWLKFMRDYDVRPIAVELSLAHPDGFASTIDLVCSRYKSKYTEKTPESNRKRVTTILDWKTGGIFSGYEVQLAFNKRVFEHHYPSIKIDKVENFTYRENSRSTMYYKKDQTGKCSPDQLDAIIKIWRQKGKSRPNDLEVLNGSVGVEDASADRYTNVPIDLLIQEKHNKIDAEIEKQNQ